MYQRMDISMYIHTVDVLCIINAKSISDYHFAAVYTVGAIISVVAIIKVTTFFGALKIIFLHHNLQVVKNQNKKNLKKDFFVPFFSSKSKPPFFLNWSPPPGAIDLEQ